MAAAPAHRRQSFKKEGADGQVRYHCSQCDRDLEASEFIPSAIRRRSPVCRHCRRNTNYERRHRSPDSEAADALYAMERTRFGRQGLIPLDLVASILDAAGRQSALSGATERLRIRRFWEDLPLSAENAVVVTADENRVLGRKSIEARLALFPEALVTRMQAWRAEQLRLRDTAQ